jgi:quinoprotein glucose dehydrogenase
MSRANSAVARLALIGALGAAAAMPASGQGSRAVDGAAPAATGWPTYGHDSGGQRFSPLTELTPATAPRLQVAWVYHMRPKAAPAVAAPASGAAPAGGSEASAQVASTGRFASSESTPLVVGNVMYLATPYHRVVALDAATGQERWAFELPTGNPSTRGLEYFPGDAQTPAQVVFGSSDAKL